MTKVSWEQVRDDIVASDDLDTTIKLALAGSSALGLGGNHEGLDSLLSGCVTSDWGDHCGIALLTGSRPYKECLTTRSALYNYVFELLSQQGLEPNIELQGLE